MIQNWLWFPSKKSGKKLCCKNKYKESFKIKMSYKLLSNWSMSQAIWCSKNNKQKSKEILFNNRQKIWLEIGTKKCREKLTHFYWRQNKSLIRVYEMLPLQRLFKKAMYISKIKFSSLLAQSSNMHIRNKRNLMRPWTKQINKPAN